MAIAVNLFSATVPSSVGTNNVIFGNGLNGNSEFTTDGNGNIIIGSTAVENAIELSKGSTGVAVQIAAVGVDSNIQLNFAAQGNSGIDFRSNGVDAFFVFANVGAVNLLEATAATSGNAPILSAAGSDAAIDIQILPKGTGNLQLGNASSFTANGAVATALTSIGPTGSHTTVQEWLTIKNASGVVRYIPCF